MSRKRARSMAYAILLGGAVLVAAFVGVTALFSRSPYDRAASVGSRVPRDRADVSRAKAALIALFAVKEGERPPELPALSIEERNHLAFVIENELTDADGCDAEAVRREFLLFMECGGDHVDFLSAYRAKLLKRVR